MRITGGEFGGRQIKAGDDHSIRPSTDKVRQAVFNMLAARLDITDARVLDLFAGAGSLGLEALSRGAATCVFADISSKSLSVVKENIDALGIKDKSKVLKADCLRSHKIAIEDSIDLVFMDPPFSRQYEEEALSNLEQAYWLNYNAYVVVETDRADFDAPIVFEAVQTKDYGRSKIHIFQFKGNL